MTSITQLEISVYFDFADVLYLTQHLTISELRLEIKSAERRGHWVPGHWQVGGRWVPDAFHQDRELDFPWADYALACRQAIADIRDLALLQPKSTTPSTGYRIDTELLKGRHDIVATIERYTQLRKSGNRFIGLCPLHDDHSPSLVVYPDDQTFHCFGCQAHGDVISFVQLAENTDFRGAAAILGGL